MDKRKGKTLKRTRLTALLLCVLMTVSFCACSSGSDNTKETQPAVEEPTKEYTLSAQRKVIIDTDTGADDAAALILAAKAPNIDILGVTTLAGNTDIEQSTRNALASLELAGCSAPVYKGSTENFSGDTISVNSVFGEDGMGEMDLVHPNGKAQEEDAISYILDTVSKNPDEIEIIMLGPATNIAKAIKRDPDTMKKVKRIWSLGSTGYGHGNATPVSEFNVYLDPYAYQVMLDSGIEVTVVSLSVCGDEAAWTEKEFEALDKTNDIGHFVSAAFTKLREFYKNNHSGGKTSVCDPLAVMCAVYDDFVTDSLRCHGSCITDQGEAYGQVVFYQEGFTYDLVTNDFNYSATLVTELIQADYFNLFQNMIRQ